MTTDDNGEVLQYYNPNSSIEKLGNDLAKVTVKYGSSNSSAEFKIYNENDVYFTDLFQMLSQKILSLIMG